MLLPLLLMRPIALAAGENVAKSHEYNKFIFHFPSFRGTSFKREYGNIYQIHSVLPNKVNVMALTTTASPETKRVILNSLEMVDAFVLERIPNKTNIKYTVCPMPKDLSEVLKPVLCDVKINGLAAEKTIVFCLTYHDFNEVSMHTFSSLFDCGLGYLLVPPEPMCQMFSATTEERVKNSIVLAFTKPDSCLRIVIAMVAFGMGLDAPNVTRIIHFGPSESVEAYIQETGHCGHSGQSSTATLYYRKRDLATTSDVGASMKQYCGNSGCCRQKMLMKEFHLVDDISSPLPKHMCCDICECECDCTSCSTVMNETEDSESAYITTEPLSHHQKKSSKNF